MTYLLPLEELPRLYIQRLDFSKSFILSFTLHNSFLHLEFGYELCLNKDYIYSYSNFIAQHMEIDTYLLNLSSGSNE